MFAEDFSNYTSTADFGTAATYNGSTSVNGIFDNGFLAVQGATDVEGSAPSFLFADADIPAVAQGGTLLVGAVTYSVIGVHPDGTGMTMLALREA